MSVKAEGLPPIQGQEHRTEIYSRAANRTLRVRDARAEIAQASRRSPNEKSEIAAFLESKRQTVRSHTGLSRVEKARALAAIDRAAAVAGTPEPSAEAGAEGDSGGGEGSDDDPPVPGGVGFGVFYTPAYKLDFDSGTVADFYILCPTFPGGNVTRWLYLTAMNRASMGVEALVAYEGQRELQFRSTIGAGRITGR